jgi:hypothetical protein
MANIDLTANQLLGITQPENLFTNDLDTATSEYHALSRRWHPDANPGIDTSNVFIHIKALYDTATGKIGTVYWNSYHRLILTKKDGSGLSRKFHSRHTFELGDCYVGDVAVTYVIKHDFELYYQNAIDMINALPYRDARLRAVIAPLMPNIETTFEADEGLVLVLKKSKDVLNLGDILNHFGKLSDRHTSWIFGQLMNICCYLQFVARLTHNGISPEAIFIDPAVQSAHLFGGWWYATPKTEQQLLGAPKYTVDYGYRFIKGINKPDFRNDPTLAKAVARQLLGDVNGLTYLTKDSILPKLIVEWLAQPASGNALTDYKEWEAVRHRSFGQRFAPLSITAKDLYPDTH